MLKQGQAYKTNDGEDEVLIGKIEPLNRTSSLSPLVHRSLIDLLSKEPEEDRPITSGKYLWQRTR